MFQRSGRSLLLASTPADPVVWGSVQAGAGDLCALCGEHLYILERLCADGRFFHRSCFRCHTCEATLWPGGYEQHPGDGKLAWEISTDTLALSLPEGKDLETAGEVGTGHEVTTGSRWHLSSPGFKVSSVPSKSLNVGF